jgi:hypothetical protein
MDDETTEALRALTERLEDAELRCKIVAYAMRGALSQLNPNAQVVARSWMNTAVLAYCPDGQRARRLNILVEMFPDARDRSGDKDFIPPQPE